jgi:hypothetical protein
MEFNKIIEEWNELREASPPWLATLSYFVKVDYRVLSRFIGDPFDLTMPVFSGQSPNSKSLPEEMAEIGRTLARWSSGTGPQ